MKSRQCFGKPKRLSGLSVLPFLLRCRQSPSAHPTAQRAPHLQTNGYWVCWIPACGSLHDGGGMVPKPAYCWKRSEASFRQGFIPPYSAKALQSQTFSSPFTPTPGSWRLTRRKQLRGELILAHVKLVAKSTEYRQNTGGPSL